MISAWEIYWVMQLDSINAVLTTFGVLTLIVAVITGLIYIISSTPPTTRLEDETAVVMRPIAMRTSTAAALLWLAIAFVPTTKTAAVMIILPAVANSETVQHEANELYGIAKDALRELAKPDAPAKAAEKADEEGE